MYKYPSTDVPMVKHSDLPKTQFIQMAACRSALQIIYNIHVMIAW